MVHAGTREGIIARNSEGIISRMLATAIQSNKWNGVHATWNVYDLRG